jgi:hypothetical protein
MRTPISKDVKHKLVKLDKRVVELLLELEYDKYKDYVLPDGSLVVEIDKLSYGYMEAAHYWYETLAETFTSNSYETSGKGKCLFVKKDENSVAICGTSVDDCLFVCNRNDEWIATQIKMLKIPRSNGGIWG